MRKAKLLAVTFATCMVLALAVGCAGVNKDSYVGTWYLEHSEGEEGSPSIFSAEDLESLRASGSDIYLDLASDDSVYFNNTNIVDRGTWAFENSEAMITFESTLEMTAKLESNKLVAKTSDTTFYFEKGETIDRESDSDENGHLSMADENGLSIVMESGEKLPESVTVADDETCSIVIDGTGVAPMGDPGFNMQVENKTDEPISIWVPDPFQVGEKSVMVYLYVNLNAHESNTAFLEFDTDQIGSKSADSLVDVTGEIRVDTQEGEKIATYEVKM